jgi:putative ABC transport system permease protein
VSPWETLSVAARALLRNKLRSFLTALGIIIGVAAVIAMVSIGEGAKARVEEAFAAMGTNVLVVSSGSTTAGGAKGGSGSLPTLTWDDLKAIAAEVSTIERAAPRLHTNAQVISDDRNWTTQITGTTPAFLEIRRWPMATGPGFTEADVDAGSKVVVLGQTVREKLYGPAANPVGQVVRIRSIPFEVVGVAASKGQSQSGQDYDDTVFMPSTTFLSKIQGGLQKFIPGTIVIGVVSDDLTADAQTQVTALLRERHHIEPDTDDDFSIKNLAETATRKEESTRTLTALLAAIAAVSLLVGGIGIMNIMLVSVTERTREIGVRMAIGAKPRHILAQFLTEALTLSAAGGLLGVTLGIGVADGLAAQFDWPMLIRADVVLIAVAFSALVGIGFGLYPARKASRMDPIEALRYE